MNEEIYNKLEIELFSLKDKIENLYIFKESENFNKINEKQQSLLKVQYRIMCIYMMILEERMKDLKDSDIK